MEIVLNHNDIRTIRHLRECLSSRQVDLVSLENLLTTLEGKLNSPPVEGGKRRQVVQPSRVMRHLQNITTKNRRA